MVESFKKMKGFAIHVTYIKVIHKVTFSFTPYPLFQWCPQSKEILLKSEYEMLKFRFDAQGSRVTIVVVQVRTVKIYVAAAVEALRKKEREDETQFTTKIGGKTNLGPSYFVL